MPGNRKGILRIFMVTLFTDIFWETATQSAVLFMPIISIILIVKLIHYFIIRSSD